MSDFTYSYRGMIGALLTMVTNQSEFSGDVTSTMNSAMQSASSVSEANAGMMKELSKLNAYSGGTLDEPGLRDIIGIKDPRLVDLILPKNANGVRPPIELADVGAVRSLFGNAASQMAANNTSTSQSANSDVQTASGPVTSLSSFLTNLSSICNTLVTNAGQANSGRVI